VELVVSDDHTSGIGVGVGSRLPFEAIGKVQPVGVSGEGWYLGWNLIEVGVWIGVSWLEGYGARLARSVLYKVVWGFVGSSFQVGDGFGDGVVCIVSWGGPS